MPENKKFLDETGLAQVAEVVNSKARIFYGTQAEWDELTADEKKVYDYAAFEDGESGFTQDKNLSPRHTLQKTMNFYQKTGQFFGDSIAAGGVAKPDSGQDLVTLTKGLLMMSSLTNLAVGSTRFTHGDVNPTIIDKIKETTLDKDVIFIAGGINDWQSQANLEDYAADLEGLMQYLTENYTGNVIFISPINYVLEKISWDNGYKQATNKIEIIEYRRILEQLVLKYNFNLVCGELFPFPANLGERANVLLADGLHPTTYGHQLYAVSLCAALGCQVENDQTLANYSSGASSWYRFTGKSYQDGRTIFIKQLAATRASGTTVTFSAGIKSRVVAVIKIELYTSTNNNYATITEAEYNYENDTITATVPATYTDSWVWGAVLWTFDSSKIEDNSY